MAGGQTTGVSKRVQFPQNTHFCNYSKSISYNKITVRKNVRFELEYRTFYNVFTGVLWPNTNSPLRHVNFKTPENTGVFSFIKQKRTVKRTIILLRHA